jgi:hypothetical protein
MTSFGLRESRDLVSALCLALLLTWGVAAAQTAYSSQKITEQDWFKKLPPKIRIPALAAEMLANEGKYEDSIDTLQAVLSAKETRKARGMFRAWLHQWLAYNYAVLDSLEVARKHVMLSLDSEIDIWPDYLDNSLQSDVRILYQQCYAEILNRFLQKRRSWRIAVGTITRADFSYRYGFFDVALGIGSTVVFFEKVSNLFYYNAAFFRDLLVYLRLQRMRKTIKRLTAGVYLELALMEDREDEKFDPAPALSGGPILSYAYPSGWEMGSSFEVARFVFKRDAEITPFSQTIDYQNGAFSYGNFEFYLRKWF